MTSLDRVRKIWGEVRTQLERKYELLERPISDESVMLIVSDLLDYDFDKEASRRSFIDWSKYTLREKADLTEIMYFGRELCNDKVKYGAWIFKDSIIKDQAFVSGAYSPMDEKAADVVIDYVEHALGRFQ